jgi:hypothetical protein
MKKLIIILTLILGANIVSAQRLHLESGVSVNNFDYKNSNGVRLQNLKAVNGNYLGFGYSQELFTEKLLLKVDFNYSTYGSIGSDPDYGNFIEWDLSYAGIAIGFDLVALTFKKIELKAKGGASAARLLRGYQIINNVVTGLNGNEDFKGTLITPFLGLGLAYPVMENLDFYIQFISGKSMDILDSREILKIESNTLSFGVMINLSRERREKHVGITNEQK